MAFDIPTDRAINSLDTLDGGSSFYCSDFFDFSHFDFSTYALAECVWFDDSTIHMKRVPFINLHDNLKLKSNIIIKAFCNDDRLTGCDNWPKSIINQLNSYVNLPQPSSGTIIKPRIEFKMDENEISKIIKTNDGKIILRKAMSKYIPKDISTATKQGFSAPDKSWFKGESIEFVKSKLLNNNAKIYKYMDKTTTQKLINDHLSGNQNRRLFIWSLLNLEEWINIYDK